MQQSISKDAERVKTVLQQKIDALTKKLESAKIVMSTKDKEFLVRLDQERKEFLVKIQSVQQKVKDKDELIGQLIRDKQGLEKEWVACTFCTR